MRAPSGWGFRTVHPARARRSDRALVLLALRRAPRELLALSAGLIARDCVATLRVDYRTAYRAAQFLRMRPNPRATW